MIFRHYEAWFSAGICAIKSLGKQPKSKNYATILPSFWTKIKDNKMSKKDAIKSKINTLTAVMVVFLTALLAVAGYAFVNRREFDFADGCFIVVGVSGLIGVVCGCALWIKKELKRLEKKK